MRRTWSLLGFPIVAALLFVALPAAAQTYTVTDLGDLGGGSAVAYAINASGQVAGASSTDSGEGHGFLWLPSPAYGLPAGMHDLGTLDGTYSEALSINASGQVVGRAFLAGDSAYHAALWLAEGGVIDLGTLGGKNSQAFGINDAGEVVGWSDIAGNLQRHAFSWRDDNGNGASDPGEMVDLGHLGGGTSIAYGINAAGQIVGTSSTPSFASHAFRTTADGLIDPNTDDLGTLGGFSSTAYKINAAGQVAGHSQTFGNLTNHAFRTTAGNSPINPNTDGLGSLGGTRSEAWGINASGQAVGWSYLSGSTTRTAFFSSGSGMVNLNSLIDPAQGWSLDAAFAINDNGQIVGSGSGPAGASRAFRAQFPMSLDPDFNGDGKIDAADLDEWLVNFGLNADSDADGDGDTDGADFLAWQLQLSPAAPEAQSSTAVPEPAASLLGATGLGVLTRRRAQSIRERNAC